MNTRIIGLAGNKGAGKTTIGTELTRMLGDENSVLISFADPLRAFATVCGFDLSAKEEVDRRLHMTPRRFMQLAGTEFGRDILGQDFWIRSLEKRLLSYSKAFAIIHDVRFPNEANWVRRMGGSVIWLDRPGLEVTDEHASERSLLMSDCDEVAFNDSAVEIVAMSAYALSVPIWEARR